MLARITHLQQEIRRRRNSAMVQAAGLGETLGELDAVLGDIRQAIESQAAALVAIGKGVPLTEEDLAELRAIFDQEKIYRSES